MLWDHGVDASLQAAWASAAAFAVPPESRPGSLCPSLTGPSSGRFCCCPCPHCSSSPHPPTAPAAARPPGAALLVPLQLLGVAPRCVESLLLLLLLQLAYVYLPLYISRLLVVWSCLWRAAPPFDRGMPALLNRVCHAYKHVCSRLIVHKIPIPKGYVKQRRVGALGPLPGRPLPGMLRGPLWPPGASLLHASTSFRCMDSMCIATIVPASSFHVSGVRPSHLIEACRHS